MVVESFDLGPGKLQASCLLWRVAPSLRFLPQRGELLQRLVRFTSTSTAPSTELLRLRNEAGNSADNYYLLLAVLFFEIRW